jgi:hypothetical protein
MTITCLLQNADREGIIDCPNDSETLFRNRNRQRCLLLASIVQLPVVAPTTANESIQFRL